MSEATQTSSTQSIRFQDLETFTAEDVKAAFARNNPNDLAMVSITIAISSPDFLLAQDVCIRLCSYKHPQVRGNALASLGHLARRFRRLDEDRVKPLVEAGLADMDNFVRAHAKSAADEMHQFLGWDIAGHVYGI